MHAIVERAISESRLTKRPVSIPAPDEPAARSILVVVRSWASLEADWDHDQDEDGGAVWAYEKDTVTVAWHVCVRVGENPGDKP